jgi:hypothetical protein
MNQTLIVIRIFFFAICLFLRLPDAPTRCRSGTTTPVSRSRFAACIGALVSWSTCCLKGFSLRGLSAVTFGLFTGWLVATFMSNSPLFESGDPQTLFVARLALFVICSYLAPSLRCAAKDEFSLGSPKCASSLCTSSRPWRSSTTSAHHRRAHRGCLREQVPGYASFIPRHS